MTEKIYECVALNDEIGVIEQPNLILFVELKTGHIINIIKINYV